VEYQDIVKSFRSSGVFNKIKKRNRLLNEAFGGSGGTELVVGMSPEEIVDNINKYMPEDMPVSTATDWYGEDYARESDHFDADVDGELVAVFEDDEGGGLELFVKNGDLIAFDGSNREVCNSFQEAATFAKQSSYYDLEDEENFDREYDDFSDVRAKEDAKALRR
tara:strand:- start:1612 stop:2106 length:495 start_codon:yes stop_codon:yes gene_type:complete